MSTDNKIIYLMVEFGGDYDEAWEHVHFASHNKTRINDEIACIVDYRNKITELANTLPELYKEFEKNNPEPPRGDQIPVPKWKAGLRKEEITDEMRAERARIEEYNRGILHEWAEKVFVISEKWREIVKGVLINAGYDPESEMIPSSMWNIQDHAYSLWDSGFRIDDVEVRD